MITKYSPWDILSTHVDHQIMIIVDELVNCSGNCSLQQLHSVVSISCWVYLYWNQVVPFTKLLDKDSSQ